MAEADLEAGLRSLRKSLRQIKALLAWEQLKQAEARPNQPPSFTLNEPVEEDLKSEYSFFLFTSVQIHNALSDITANTSETNLRQIKHELAKIERQFHSLGLQQRFYKVVNQN